jgi:hypothetical protein
MSRSKQIAANVGQRLAVQRRRASAVSQLKVVEEKDGDAPKMS